MSFTPYARSHGMSYIPGVVAITTVIILIAAAWWNFATTEVTRSYDYGDNIWREELVVGPLMKWVVTLAVILVLGVIPLSMYISARFREYLLAEDRVICNFKFLSRSSTSMPYDRIGQVGIHESMLGRLLGYGTIVLTYKGNDGDFYIRNVPNVHDWHTAISSRAAAA